MHVDWRWIKQRPHFLAEELARQHEIHILHRAGVTPRRHLIEGGAPAPLSPLLPLPWSWNVLRSATRRMQCKWVTFMTWRFEPDVIWITHPSLLEAIPAALSGLPVVYDCMDDAYGFPASSGRRKLLAQLEQNLVMRAAMIFCSSLRLCRLLVSRHGSAVQSKITLVRNGVSSSLLANAGITPSPETDPSRCRVKLAYVGTIAEWIDFGSVAQALDEITNVEFHFVGPATARVPRHERLHFHHPLPHSQLRKFVSQFDAYVMPFLLSPLIEAVDPVKIYEYLAFGKEVLTVRYPEIERFSEFVHFYQAPSDFVRLVRSLVAGSLERKNTPSGTRAFLAANTWESRGEQVFQLMTRLSQEAPA